MSNVFRWLTQRTLGVLVGALVISTPVVVGPLFLSSYNNGQEISDMIADTFAEKIAPHLGKGNYRDVAQSANLLRMASPVESVMILRMLEPNGKMRPYYQSVQTSPSASCKDQTFTWLCQVTHPLFTHIASTDILMAGGEGKEIRPVGRLVISYHEDKDLYHIISILITIWACFGFATLVVVTHNILMLRSIRTDYLQLFREVVSKRSRMGSPYMFEEFHRLGRKITQMKSELRRARIQSAEQEARLSNFQAMLRDSHHSVRTETSMSQGMTREMSATLSGTLLMIESLEHSSPTSEQQETLLHIKSSLRNVMDRDSSSQRAQNFNLSMAETCDMADLINQLYSLMIPLCPSHCNLAILPARDLVLMRGGGFAAIFSLITGLADLGYQLVRNHGDVTLSLENGVDDTLCVTLTLVPQKGMCLIEKDRIDGTTVASALVDRFKASLSPSECSMTLRELADDVIELSLDINSRSVQIASPTSRHWAKKHKGLSILLAGDSPHKMKTLDAIYRMMGVNVTMQDIPTLAHSTEKYPLVVLLNGSLLDPMKSIRVRMLSEKVVSLEDRREASSMAELLEDTGFKYGICYSTSPKLQLEKIAQYRDLKNVVAIGQNDHVSLEGRSPLEMMLDSQDEGVLEGVTVYLPSNLGSLILGMQKMMESQGGVAQRYDNITDLSPEAGGAKTVVFIECDLDDWSKPHLARLEHLQRDQNVTVIGLTLGSQDEIDPYFADIVAGVMSLPADTGYMTSMIVSKTQLPYRASR